jgi:hypothetical protein
MPVTTLNPDAVMIGTAKGPGIWIAPTGTAAPTDCTTAPAAAWETLGYLSEDGVKFAVSTDSEKIMSWQSKSPLRQVITGRELNAEFTMMEVSAKQLALYFGNDEKGADMVLTPAATGKPELLKMTVKTNAAAQNYAVMVDIHDTDNSMRIYFPRATLTDAGDIEITQAGVVGLPVTLSALDDNGTLAVILKEKAAKTP